MGPTSKEKKRRIKQNIWRQSKQRESVVGSFIFFLNNFSFQIFFLRFSGFCPSEFVGINTESALRDEGYA